MRVVETDLHLQNGRRFGPQATAPGDIADPVCGRNVCFCEEPPSIVRGESKFDPRRAETDLEDVVGALLAFGEKGRSTGQTTVAHRPCSACANLRQSSRPAASMSSALRPCTAEG